MIGNLNRNDVASIRRMNATIDVIKKKIQRNEEKMLQIDEEFKLKAEKKKEFLVTDTSQLKQQIEFWTNSTVAVYGKTVNELMEMILTEEEPPLIIQNKETKEEEINPAAVAPAKTEEPVEEVVDEDEVEAEPEESIPAPVEDVSELPEPVEVEPEFDGAGFTAEDNEELEDMPDFDEADAAEEIDPDAEPEDPLGGDEDWPDPNDLPDEWK